MYTVFTSGPWIAKGVVNYKGKLVTHKTEARAIAFNVKRDGVTKVVEDFRARFSGDYSLDGIIFRHMVDIPSEMGGMYTVYDVITGELFISAYQDPVFGPSVCVGFGGTGVEYMKSVMKDNTSTLFIPVLYGFDTYEKDLLSMLCILLYCIINVYIVILICIFCDINVYIV